MELRRLRCFGLCLILLLGTVQLWADVTGSILGYVRDKSGAVLPNATVTAMQVATGYSRTVVTDTSGQYSILALPPGRYRLTASVPSFQQGVVDNIDLNVNDALHFDFDLQIGSVSESISVDANALQVQTVATSTGTTIESPQILAMPLNGRSYLDLLTLQAGVSPVNTNSGYNDRGPASGLYSSSGNVSTDGQPEYANAFLVNGAEVNETRNMGAGLIPNADSIAEFRLLTNSFSAEYGKFTGSVMNTVTKSGTNRFHGTLFEFYRNQGLDATSYFDTTKAELKQHQFGGVVGGPIVKDKLFFFTDVQQTRRVAGASTGVLDVLSADERNGIFPDSLLGNAVQGDAWAATLSARGGVPVTAGVTTYNQLGTPVTTTDGTGASVPGHDISAFIDPVTALTMSQIPAANHRGKPIFRLKPWRITRRYQPGPADRLRQSHDGGLVVLLSLRRCDRGPACLPAGVYGNHQRARLSGDGALAQSAVLDEQHEDLRYYRGQRRALAVFPHGGANGPAGSQFDDFRLRCIRLQYRSHHRRSD